MIIQEHADVYRCITQHDHGRISGFFAQAWRDPLTDHTADEDLIAATYLHDILWVPLDLLPRILDDRPADFIAFPEADKLRGYTHGIDAVASLDPYIGLLHARHFSGFVSREAHPAYRADMDARISALRAKLPAEVLARNDDDLALLRLFDVFSLLVCMTGPHIERTPPPWLNPSPLLVQRSLDAFWPDQHTFVVAPYCFDRELTLSIPYRSIPREADAATMIQAYIRAPVEWQRITVRAATPQELQTRRAKIA